MNKMMLAAGAAALSLIAGAALAQAPATPAAQAAAAPQAPMQAKPVKPGVFMITGNGGNTTVVVGKTGLVVVDTKNPGEAIYAELMDKIKGISPLPVAEVLITHHHADHSGNTLLFLNHGVKVIGHQQELQALQTYVSTATPRPTAPSVTYNDVLVTNPGGVRVEAHHWGAGHTAGDTLVYFPEQKVVSGGDEIVGVTPNIDSAFGGSLTGWLKSLDAVAKLDFDYVIPGHGNDPISRADFMAYKKKWETVAERGRAAVKSGVAKDKLMASIKTDDLGWNINTGIWLQPARVDALYAELSK